MTGHHVRASIAATALVAALALGACSSTGSNASSAPAAAAPATTMAAVDVPASASPGCTAVPAVLASEQKVDITSGTDARYYLQHVPPAHNGVTPVPLVLDLHGYSEGATIHEQQSALGPFGDLKGFVTITPQGQGPVARWDTTLGGSDLAFLGQVLDQAEATLCVDQNRIFVTGLSNGAFMTSAVACQFAGRVAAAAPVAGIRDLDGCRPSRPVPVIAFHGTADQFVPYDGGLGSAAANLPAPDGSGRTLGEISAVDPSQKGPSIPEITASWAGRNGCQTTPTESTVTADVTLLSFDCPAGAEVELYRVTDGGHSWPGSEFSKKIVSIVGKTTDTISADELMWAFFVAHPIPPSN
jgi:polyhydroxybutyrate depolymerase